MTINLKNANPSAIIFDWDNTLANTWPLIEKAMYQMLEKYNMQNSLDEYRKRTFGMPMRQSFPLLFKDKADEMHKCYVKNYQKIREDNLELNPYAEEFIKHANEKNIPLFIVSNKLGKSLRYEVQKLNFSHYFQNIVGSLDTEFDKPNKTPVEFAIKGHKLNLDENVWFIGDSEVDVNCALNCDCTAILYGETYKQTSRMMPDSPKIVKINCFSDLI
ncbi:MAG: HAD-IA family hydrolase [Rickettsiales bacterium]|nr:HAD-IA family hydrolase [Rickettsiales bacterium]